MFTNKWRRYHWGLVHLQSQGHIADRTCAQFLLFEWNNSTSERIFSDICNRRKKTTASAKSNPIGILCTYCRYKDDGTLQQECGNASYVNLDTYKATVQAPSYENCTLQISESLLAMIIDLESKYWFRKFKTIFLKQTFSWNLSFI